MFTIQFPICADRNAARPFSGRHAYGAVDTAQFVVQFAFAEWGKGDKTLRERASKETAGGILKDSARCSLFRLFHKLGQ